MDVLPRQAAPGDREEWRLTIERSGGEAVAAQLLAGMYDASLDAFVPHAWQVPDLWPVHRPRFRLGRVRPFGCGHWASGVVET